MHATVTTAGILALPRDVDQLDALAADLAARCADHLARIAAAGGPQPRPHLEAVRRLLLRREHRSDAARRRQIGRALTAARVGRAEAVTGRDRTVLVRDLWVLEHALALAARVGVCTAAGPSGSALPQQLPDDLVDPVG